VGLSGCRSCLDHGNPFRQVADLADDHVQPVYAVEPRVGCYEVADVHQHANERYERRQSDGEVELGVGELDRLLYLFPGYLLFDRLKPARPGVPGGRP
jgi:hypothetical protein